MTVSPKNHKNTETQFPPRVPDSDQDFTVTIALSPTTENYQIRKMAAVRRASHKAKKYATNEFTITKRRFSRKIYVKP